mmetsp:Transcript_34738/g.110193  ORF Transcript_34738/g.110193 Transcript_34738/m.110193 type:complete len:322 (+) Transcript_34738:733-1698(+)
MRERRLARAIGSADHEHLALLQSPGDVLEECQLCLAIQERVTDRLTRERHRVRGVYLQSGRCPRAVGAAATVHALQSLEVGLSVQHVGHVLERINGLPYVHGGVVQQGRGLGNVRHDANGRQERTQLGISRDHQWHPEEYVDAGEQRNRPREHEVRVRPEEARLNDLGPKGLGLLDKGLVDSGPQVELADELDLVTGLQGMPAQRHLLRVGAWRREACIPEDGPHQDHCRQNHDVNESIGIFVKDEALLNGHVPHASDKRQTARVASGHNARIIHDTRPEYVRGAILKRGLVVVQVLSEDARTEVQSAEAPDVEFLTQNLP